MFKRHLLSVTLAITMVATVTLPAQAYRKAGISNRGFLPQASYMSERGRASAPFGHIEFCVHSPSECLIRSRGIARARLNRSSWRMLKQVNHKVNRSIRATSDRVAYGKIDYWSIGGRLGDCEDYALTKRHELIHRGWPSKTLLLATARDHRNRMHAVLIAHTNRGDFVLDNLTGRIRAWNKTGYKWLKRQSRQNPKRWVHLGRFPQITGALQSKSGKKLPKNSRLRKTVPPVSLTRMRGAKDVPAPSPHTKASQAILSTLLPPLPVRNAVRHSNTTIARLAARLADIQKKLAAMKKDEARIKRLLGRATNARKHFSKKQSLEIRQSRLAISRAVRKNRSVKKNTEKQRIASRIMPKAIDKPVRTRKSAHKLRNKRKLHRRKNAESKALALLKKIRRARGKHVQARHLRKTRRSARGRRLRVGQLRQSILPING